MMLRQMGDGRRRSWTDRPGPPSGHEEEGHERPVAEFRKARLTGLHMKLPVESLGGKLGSLPKNVTVEHGRLELRVGGANDAGGAAVLAGQGAREPTTSGSRRCSTAGGGSVGKRW